MATTNFRENYLGCDLVAPTSNSLDNLGRVTTATVDYLGRSLRRILRANTTAVTLNQELQFAGGEKFIVTIAGTTAASPPTAPAVGATVADGTATLLRTKQRQPWSGLTVFCPGPGSSSFHPKSGLRPVTDQAGRQRAS